MKSLIKVIVSVCAFLLVLSIIFLRTNDSSEIYIAAAQKIQTDYQLSNSIDGNLMRTVAILSGTTHQTVDQAVKFIRQHFVVEENQDIIVDGNAETKTITRFCSVEEITNRLKLFPFNFDSERIQIIQSYYAIVGLSGSTDLHGRYPRPCSGTVTSPWGVRENPLKPGFFDTHSGIDISGAWHQPIRAIADGIVYQINRSPSSYGNFIILKHSDNDTVFYSVYAHLSEIAVQRGDIVAQGEIIGKEGGEPDTDPNPGDTTGHHLHFEIRLTPSRSSNVDPAGYIY